MAAFIFGCLIFGGGAAMMGLHWDTRFKQKFLELSDDEANFHRRRYRRRMTTSGMIALVGILFMIYQFVGDRWVKAGLVVTVLILALIIVIFAFIDMGSVAKLYRLERKASATATRNLADELSRLKQKAKKKRKDPSQARDEEKDGDSDG